MGAAQLLTDEPLAARLMRLLEAAAEDGPDAARRQLGRDALLTLAEVVRLIPGGRTEVRTWVLAHVRPRKGPTQPLYRWGDVLDAMPQEGASGVASPPAAPARPRVVLDDDLPPIRPRTKRIP